MEMIRSDVFKRAHSENSLEDRFEGDSDKQDGQ